jgi:biopolymer transport protein TolR
MALSANDAFGAGGGRRRRRGRGRRGALSEINVTPLVDVMLVLVIIFMVTAVTMTSGVPIDLPKTEASAVQDLTDPVTLSVRADGRLYIGEEEVPFAELKSRIATLTGQDFEKPIFVRADAKAAYESVAQVMASLSTGGFTKINLITDTGGPSSGPSLKPGVE